MRLNWKGILLLSASLFGSFFITLRLTAPPDLPPTTPVFRPEALKTIVGNSNADLIMKLSASGFRADSGIMGHVDQVVPQPNRTVRIIGWAVDQFGDGRPLTISFYVDGEPRLTVNTAGPRDDVAKAFKLPQNITRDSGFSGTFTCEATAQAMILAINSADGRYKQLIQALCPLTF
jgi:hypothetical protein